MTYLSTIILYTALDGASGLRTKMDAAGLEPEKVAKAIRGISNLFIKKFNF